MIKKFKENEIKIKEMVRLERQRLTAKRWRVWYKFFKDGVEFEDDKEDFTASSQADIYISYIRKKASNNDWGVFVKKINIADGISKTKTWEKGYRRKW